MIRVAAALLAVLLFSAMTTVSIIRMDRAQGDSRQADAPLVRCYQAEVAHYKWAANLSSALYAGAGFTGGTAWDGCVPGRYIHQVEHRISDSAELFQEARALESATGHFRLKDGGKRAYPPQKALR